MTTKGGLPDRRPPKAVRFLPESWDGFDVKAQDLHFSRSALIEITTEASVLGIIRCTKCETPVPVKLGNLAGKTFAEWIIEAEKVVRIKQHPNHEPLLVGAEVADEAPSRADVAALAAEMTALRAQVATVVPIRPEESAGTQPGRLQHARMAVAAAGHSVIPASELPSPGTALFQPPGEDLTVTTETPREAPGSGRKKGRPAHAPNCTCAMCKPAGRNR